MKNKSALLKCLFCSGNECLTWEDISESLGIGRTTVWNNIRALRQDGYAIESVPHRGYRLVALPDSVYDYELNVLLDGTVFEGSARVFDHVTSTNDILDDLAAGGLEKAAVAAASRQMQGRGRHGRRWFSPRDKGLWFSVLLHPTISVCEFHQLTFMASVACASYLSRLCKGVSIKWPNDILIDGRKCGGILTEIKSRGDRIVYAVVGIGLNTDVAEDDFASAHLPAAGNVAFGESVRRPRKVEMLAGILREIDIFYGFILGRDFARIRTVWGQFSDIVGHKVEISHNGRIFAGRVCDVDETGALVVSAADGTQMRAYSGDVVVVRD